MNILKLKSRRINITKWLKDNKGGSWKYDGHCCWRCSDGKRHVARVAMDFTDDYNGPSGYYLYGGDNPGWLYF